MLALGLIPWIYVASEPHNWLGLHWIPPDELCFYTSICAQLDCGFSWLSWLGVIPCMILFPSRVVT